MVRVLLLRTLPPALPFWGSPLDLPQTILPVITFFPKVHFFFLMSLLLPDSYFVLKFLDADKNLETPGRGLSHLVFLLFPETFSHLTTYNNLITIQNNQCKGYFSFSSLRHRWFNLQAFSRRIGCQPETSELFPLTKFFDTNPIVN